jgi:NADP-dependent 3-hydroxy acid dehydrogenase YdfG
MNSSDKVAVSTDAVYVIFGASGNAGSIIVDSLLSKGKKVRVVGRDLGRLHRFVRQGAEARIQLHRDSSDGSGKSHDEPRGSASRRRSPS